jgi:hypothetical protein
MSSFHEKEDSLMHHVRIEYSFSDTSYHFLIKSESRGPPLTVVTLRFDVGIEPGVIEYNFGVGSICTLFGHEPIDLGCVSLALDLDLRTCMGAGTDLADVVPLGSVDNVSDRGLGLELGMRGISGESSGMGWQLKIACNLATLDLVPWSFMATRQSKGRSAYT